MIPLVIVLCILMALNLSVSLLVLYLVEGGDLDYWVNKLYEICNRGH